MNSQLRDILPRVEKPSRYIGGEVGSVRKDLAGKVKVCLAYPDLYEVGMSHLGIRILYHVLNQREDVACERVFAPGLDMEKQLRGRGLPLVSLESGLPLDRFDILGISLQYELTFTNILNILDLAGIPLLAKDREPFHPLVLGGGPIAFNPEPVAEFFDAFFLGDGEEGINDIVDCFRQWQEAGGTRWELLAGLAAISGVYVPAFYKPRYDDAGKIKQLEVLTEGQRTISARVVTDLDRAFFPTRPLVPFTRIIHDRLNLEIARGCTQGCRFCQAGSIYLPLRERRPETVAKLCRASLQSSGYDELSLLSLSVGDYSALAELFDALASINSQSGFSLSIPSLRVGSLNPELVENIVAWGANSFTIAPEAGSERLRRAINKPLAEQDILDTVRTIFKAGASVKLYFMIGLPFEQPEDIQGLVELSQALARLARQTGPRPRVRVSVSPFVPKSHTPFQWAGFGPTTALMAKQALLSKALRGGRLEYKWHKLAQSELEAVFARGDRRLSSVLLSAFRLGCRFDGWNEYFQVRLWDQAFKEAKLDSQFYLRPRSLDEILPWDHLSCGVSKQFLREELCRAEQGVESGDCRDGSCRQCGVCDDVSIYNRLAVPGSQTKMGRVRWSGFEVRKSRFKMRFRFVKAEDMALLSHLELVNAMVRAFLRASIPLAYSQGYHPRPLVSFAKALPVGVEGLDEWADVDLYQKMESQVFLSRINDHLPHGLKVVEAFTVLPSARSLASSVMGESYWVFVRGGDRDSWERKITSFWEAKTFPMYREREGKGKQVDLKEFVQQLRWVDRDRLELALVKKNGLMVKPGEVLAEVLGLADQQSELIEVVKARTLFSSSPLSSKQKVNL
ncbi:MAG: TIGR03960 family B12-binding radical SAM protein [Thermodesulfobacteriota bacterium]